MKYPKPRQRFLLLAMFCVAASLLIALSPLGLAHANQERVAKANKGSPCAGGSRSCVPMSLGVVCNHWEPLLEDNFEGAFPGPVSGYNGEWRNSDGPYYPYYWGLTSCTSPDNSQSIWCGYPESPCPVYPYTYGGYVFSGTTYRPLYDKENPPVCDIIKISFDYNYKEEDPTLHSKFIVPWCLFLPPLGEWAHCEVAYDANDVFEMFGGSEGYVPTLGFTFDFTQNQSDWWGVYVDNVKAQAGKECSFIDFDANAGEPGLGDGAGRFQNNAGDGINIATGNVHLPQTDFTTARDGIPSELNLQFTRTYNSQLDYNGPLGYGWTHNYNLQIIPIGDNLVALRRERGQVLYFEDQGGEWFVGQKGVKNKLKKDAQGQYVFTTVNHITYTFGPDGKLLEIIDLHGNKLTMDYDEDGRLGSVADDFGVSIVFLYQTYEYDTLLYATYCPENPQVDYLYEYDPIYEYDDYGHIVNATYNLTSVTYYPTEGEPQIRQYLYEDPYDSHNLTGIIDENGDNYTTFNYDTMDQAILSRKAANANQIHVDYSGNFTVKVTNSFSQVSEYTREIKDGMGYITAITKAQESGGLCSTCAPIGSYEYSDVHTIEGITDARGYESSFSYDDWGNILSRTQAVGTENERTTTNTYDMFELADGIPVNKVQTTTTESIDTPGQSRVTELSYDHNDGDVYQMTESGYVDGLLKTRTTSLTHNDYGQITLVNGPRTDVNDVTEFIYYPNEASYGNKRARLQKIITPVGATEYLDYDACGRPLNVKDANNVETIYTYTYRGWIKTRTTAGSTYTYTYDKVGNLTQVEDPEGRITINRYDDAHRLYETEDPLGNRTVYTLDTEGNRTKEELFDNQEVLAKTVSMEYDNQNRLEKIIHPDGTQGQYSYDPNGNVISTTNEEGDIASYEYDELNRLIKGIQHVDGEDIVTEYTYDSHDNLTSVIDAKGHTTTYDYDDFKEVLTTTSPDTGTNIFAYDDAGNLKQKTDARAVTITYSYDVMNRLTMIDFPNDFDITYSYDSASVSCGIGKLTGMNDASGTYTYHYNEQGRFKKEEKNILGIPYTTEYGYDASSLLTGITYPGGRTATYGLDGAGRIESVTTGAQLLANNVKYMPFGPIKEWDFGNSIHMQAAYNNRYFMTDMNAGNLLDFHYTHYGDGNIETITDNLDPLKDQSFTYDEINRLTNGSGIYGDMGYGYDDAGNRLQKTLNGAPENYTYIEGTNLLSKVNWLSFWYDANGNTKQMGDKVFTYNQNQRLIKVTKIVFYGVFVGVSETTLGEYTYNGRGQRIIKEAAGATTIYHYDIGGNLIAEGSPDGTITSEYIYMGGYRLARIDSPGNTIYYYLNDHIGTPRKMLDESGAVVWAATYTPFGEAHVEPSSTIENRFRFSGQYYDEETGLHYNYFRYYNPQTGRYLEADPIGLRGGLNLYTYVSNNPANLIDPYGLGGCSDGIDNDGDGLLDCDDPDCFDDPDCPVTEPTPVIDQSSLTSSSANTSSSSSSANTSSQTTTDYGVDHSAGYSSGRSWVSPPPVALNISRIGGGTNNSVNGKKSSSYPEWLLRDIGPSDNAWAPWVTGARPVGVIMWTPTYFIIRSIGGDVDYWPPFNIP